jgi:hypothetical protein
MVADPVATPLTCPEPSTVAIPVAELLHDPPLTPSLKVIMFPVHTDAGPLIGVGGSLSVIVVVTKQPAPDV